MWLSKYIVRLSTAKAKVFKIPTNIFGNFRIQLLITIHLSALKSCYDF